MMKRWTERVKRIVSGPGSPGASWMWPLALAGLTGMLVVAAACENNNDPTAPSDSMIIVSASPQTVVLGSGGTGTTTITATVLSANGTRLPDQEVTFTTTAGALSPPAQTPLTTDDLGQATSLLTTSSSATVAAMSGSISQTTQIQTTTAQLTTFALNVVPNQLFTCNDTLTLTATVLDTGGNPVPNVLVAFDDNPDGSTTVTGNFVPNSQRNTDANGEAIVMWTPVGECSVECQAAGGFGGECFFFFQAGLAGTDRSFDSIIQEVDDQIP